MKNKKWKRKAKRLVGYCMTTRCPNCKYYKAFIDWDEEIIFDCAAPSYLPGASSIRIVEKELRGKQNEINNHK